MRWSVLDSAILCWPTGSNASERFLEWGPITALTWALEIGDVSRFRTIKQAISYCGLCGDERNSADKAMRMLPSWLRDRVTS